MFRLGGRRFSLRTAPEGGDVEQVRALVTATGFFSDEEIAVAVELVEERLAKGTVCDYRFIFAEEDWRLTAYSCFGRVPLTRSSYDLYWIVVAPEAQGAGIGRSLLARTESAIAGMGGTALYAETSGRLQYAPTRSFYRRCGYREAALFPDFYAPGDDKIVFEKRLDPAAEVRAAG
jgi:ribosomal protein S18 acetylase RimI-like enzyme